MAAVTRGSALAAFLAAVHNLNQRSLSLNADYTESDTRHVEGLLDNAFRALQDMKTPARQTKFSDSRINFDDDDDDDDQETPGNDDSDDDGRKHAKRPTTINNPIWGGADHYMTSGVQSTSRSPQLVLAGQGIVLQLWPHLVIYLDTPVSKCLENIKRRGNVDEIAAVDETYLKTIEESYKDALKEFRRHSKILAYDWSTPGDTDRVVEDIERVDLDFFEWHSGDVLEEWYTLVDEVGWNGWRQHVTSKHDARRLAFDAIPTHEVGELYVNPRDTGHFLHVMRKEVLKSPYGYGYIKQNGDEPAGLMNWRTAHHLPEPWYDYYHKEAYYDDLTSHETSLDWDSDSYDPDYVHHHH